MLWLYGPEHNITEVGVMNLFVYWTNEQGGTCPSSLHTILILSFCTFSSPLHFFLSLLMCVEDELVTASLNDKTILPGVTRDSILKHTAAMGRFKVSERTLNMQEIVKAHKEKRVSQKSYEAVPGRIF